MAYSPPKVKDVVEKAPDPVINMAETTAITKNERKKQGMLSTFLQPRNRTAGMLANIVKQQELGSSNV